MLNKYLLCWFMNVLGSIGLIFTHNPTGFDAGFVCCILLSMLGKGGIRDLQHDNSLVSLGEIVHQDSDSASVSPSPPGSLVLTTR